MKSSILIAVISSLCLCLAMPAEKRSYGYSGGNYNYHRPAYSNPIYIPKPVVYEQALYLDKPYPVYKPHPQPIPVPVPVTVIIPCNSTRTKY